MRHSHLQRKKITGAQRASSKCHSTKQSLFPQSSTVLLSRPAQSAKFPQVMFPAHSLPAHCMFLFTHGQQPSLNVAEASTESRAIQPARSHCLKSEILSYISMITTVFVFVSLPAPQCDRSLKCLLCGEKLILLQC